jgi:hypothetical protein
MKALWHTQWQGQEIVVYRNDEVVDRVDAGKIERVLLLYRGSGDFPGDVAQVVVELPDECVVFGIETGFAGRVNFERQAFWEERGCVHWVPQAKAHLPLKLRTGAGLLRLSPPPYVRVPRSEVAALLERWPIQGPQTWEQRKRQRIERGQPFSVEHA